MFYKKGVIKNFAIFTGKHLCQGLSLSCNFVKKETLAYRFSSECCKIFKNTFFTEHLWMTAFILQQLLPLHFGIIYSWLLSSSEKTLVWKKNSSIYFKDFTDLDFFYTDIFFHFLLRKAYAVL